MSALCACALCSYQFRGRQMLGLKHCSRGRRYIRNQTFFFETDLKNILGRGVIDRRMCVDMRLGTEENLTYRDRGILMEDRSVLGAQRFYSACPSEKWRPRQWTGARRAHAGTDRRPIPGIRMSHSSKLLGLLGRELLGPFPAMANRTPDLCLLLAGGAGRWSVRGERDHVCV